MADHSRRSLFQLAGAAALLRGQIALAQQSAPPPTKQGRGTNSRGPGGRGGLDEPFPALERHSTVAVISGAERRKNVHDALVAIDKQILPGLKSKKFVVIKPNNVSTVNQLAATHVDALRGILDYLAPRFKGPVTIAEASAGQTHEGFENFKYPPLLKEYAKQKVSLVDLNEDARFETIALLDGDMHPIPCRIARMLVDPDAFVISSAMLKTHNTVIATLSVKNMVLGAPLHQAPKDTARWNEKRKFHFGVRQTHYNMLLTAQKLQPHWGVALIDGFEGMEGNGPGSGTPVSSKIAIASTDFIAADRVGVEAMSINPDWLGYLKYSSALGLGQYDLSKIDVVGAKLADVKKPYRMHADIELELEWQGPMTELPPQIGWLTPFSEYPPCA
jgi:uncharacterized protein (DUF362 family)